MSWPAPIPGPGPGQWAQSVPSVMTPSVMTPSVMTPSVMTPEMGYTPDQWVAMQQQSWQQWTQWQQQYAEWQNQYGRQYAEQMQVMQMGGAPPPPPTTAPPMPPPPDNPPPPPPHENNQPLFGQPTMITASSQQSNDQRNNSNIVINTSVPQDKSWNNQKRNTYDGNTSVVVDIKLNSNKQSVPPTSSSVNSEALKKFAEDEAVFDNQLKAMDEEMEKWRKQNINFRHEQAYKDYEKTYDTWKSQVMKRREQLQEKRARLISSSTSTNSVKLPLSTTSVDSPNVSNGNLAGKPQMHNINKSVPPSRPNRNIPSLMNSNRQHNFDRNDKNNSYRNNQQYGKDDSSRGKNYNKGYDNHYDDTYQSNQLKNNDYDNNQSHNDANFAENEYNDDPYNDNQYNDDPYADENQYSENQYKQKQYTANQYNDKQFNKNQYNKNQYNKNQYNKNKYNENQYDDDQYTDRNNSFLPSNTSNKGIPGLDLVVEGDNESSNVIQNKSDVIDITEDHQQNSSQPFNYTEISKGINNILGDEKIMNILSMVRDKIVPPQENKQNIVFENRPTSKPYGKVDLSSNNDNNFGNSNQLESQQSMPQIPNQHRKGIQDTNRYGGQRNDNMPYNMNRNRNMPHALDIDRSFSSRPVDYPDNKNDHQRTINNSMEQENVVPVKKWEDVPMIVPDIIVDYDHKPLRLEVRSFIEPFQTFEYDHKPTEGDKPTRFDRPEFDVNSRKRELGDDRYSRGYNRDIREIDRTRGLDREYSRDDRYSRGYRDDVHDDRKKHDDRRRPDDSYDRRLGYRRRHDDRDRERDRERERDRDRERRLDDISRNRLREKRDSKSADTDDSKSKKSKTELECESSSKDITNAPVPGDTQHIIMINDILEHPGREMRHDKILIILRGLPGSGKSYLAKLIRDREAELGGSARIMSIDDYFMQDIEVNEEDPVTGKTVQSTKLGYEYDCSQEESYLNSLKRAIKRTIKDGFFSLLIFDANNETLKSYADIWNFSRQNGFQVYICDMEADIQACFKRNIHNRTLEDIQMINSRYYLTPKHHIRLDATALLQSAAIQEVHMEDVDSDDDVVMEDVPQDSEVPTFTSKWEKMEEANQLARLDGISKPLRPSSLTMEDYLQLDDWKPAHEPQKGKKTVRWADIEERRKQEKMRAVGFVLGQTDWGRMTDPTMGSSALTQTKYIERVKRM